MRITDIRASIAATANAIPELTTTTGQLLIGIGASEYRFDRSTHFAFARRLRAFTSDDVELSLDMQNGTTSGGTSYVAPTAQVETATASGTITGAGNAVVTVTSAGMTGSPLAIDFAVAVSDTAATWAAKARTALSANATIAERFTVGGTSTAISLTRIIDDYGYANDTTLNIALANGTCTGITNAATSANTTSGAVATGRIWERGDSVDAEGVGFPSLSESAKLIRVKVIRGSFVVSFTGGQLTPIAQGAEFILAGENSIAGADVSLTPQTSAACEILIFAVMEKS